MSAEVHMCGPGEGRIFLVGGSDYVTFKVRGKDVGEDFCQFEITTTPGFGPPLHTHDWAESFYVLDGEYEFTTLDGDEPVTIVGGPGTTVSLPRDVPHAFRNSADGLSTMLITHAPPAGLESFFEEYGVEVEKAGDVPLGSRRPIRRRWPRCCGGTACTSSPFLPARRRSARGRGPRPRPSPSVQAAAGVRMMRLTRTRWPRQQVTNPTSASMRSVPCTIAGGVRRSSSHASHGAANTFAPGRTQMTCRVSVCPPLLLLVDGFGLGRQIRELREPLQE
jgi:quercetin dioxygenase-like cupin family protein